MSKFKRSKTTVWGSGANGIGASKMLGIDQVKAINYRVEMMAKDPYYVGRDYEIKEWQIRVMAER